VVSRVRTAMTARPSLQAPILTPLEQSIRRVRV
jgi:hypothetical protein